MSRQKSRMIQSQTTRRSCVSDWVELHIQNIFPIDSASFKLLTRKLYKKHFVNLSQIHTYARVEILCFRFPLSKMTNEILLKITKRVWDDVIIYLRLIMKSSTSIASRPNQWITFDHVIKWHISTKFRYDLKDFLFFSPSSRCIQEKKNINITIYDTIKELLSNLKI